MRKITVFCPATIANVACGFDILGLAIDNIGDTMTVTMTSHKKLEITKITGADLPMGIDENVAGVAAKAMLKDLDISCGFEIEIVKNIKPGSGIGSSAASAAGVVYAINELLDRPFSLKELVVYAMQGEKLASGSLHADNVAPALMGGFVLIRSYSPIDIISINSPTELYAVVVHPQVELKTSDTRKILKKEVLLKDSIKQNADLAGLISGLYTNDYELISRSLNDYIIEPLRSLLIPFYDKVKLTAKQNGALGSGISGSGPSIFALCKGEESAVKVKKAMLKVYIDNGLNANAYHSKINNNGVKTIKDEVLQS